MPEHLQESGTDGWEPRPGEMHPVDQAFHDLAIKERDYERLKCDRLEAERDRYREALERIGEWAEYGYQDLNSGGVLAHVRKAARGALDG